MKKEAVRTAFESLGIVVEAPFSETSCSHQITCECLEQHHAGLTHVDEAQNPREPEIDSPCKNLEGLGVALRVSVEAGSARRRSIAQLEPGAHLLVPSKAWAIALGMLVDLHGAQLTARVAAAIRTWRSVLVVWALLASLPAQCQPALGAEEA